MMTLLPLQVRAQETSASNTISVIDQLKSLPLKEGVMYDFKNNRALNTLSLGIINYDSVGLDISYIGMDGLGLTLEYDLSSLPVSNIPILKYLSYLNLGYSVGYRTMAIADVQGNPKSDNQLIQGPVAFLKFKF